MNRKYLLRIFQLEGYKIGRFLRWVSRNYFRLSPKGEREPKWTPKAKLLSRLAWLLFALLLFISFSYSWLSLLLAGVLLWGNWYLLLIGALLILRPYEILNRLRVAYEIRSKIARLKSLHVIGITGSYGKTSTKMVLQPLLPDSLMTPKSYNTMFGIHAVVDLELSERFRFFICEMGAYKIGDIKEFCRLTRPSVVILTGINEQHLERFGSLQNTIQGKFEILEHCRRDGVGIVNLDNENVRENLSGRPRPATLIGYSVEGMRSEQCDRCVLAAEWRIEGRKTKFSVELAGSRHELETSLLGKGHLSNILASLIAAVELGETMEALIPKVAGLRQIPHRLECRSMQGYTLLDNSYSSNPDGFREALAVLAAFPEPKVLVTPGIVELGREVEPIHELLGGRAAEVCDEVVLVGRSAATEALFRGLRSAGFSEENVSWLGSGELGELLARRAGSGQVVLIENDLPDHYL